MPKPSLHSIETLEDEVTLLTPEEARQALVDKGFGEDDFQQIIDNKIGSHYQRALAEIAVGEAAMDAEDLGWQVRDRDMDEIKDLNELADRLEFPHLPDVSSLRQEAIGSLEFGDSESTAEFEDYVKKLDELAAHGYKDRAAAAVLKATVFRDSGRPAQYLEALEEVLALMQAMNEETLSLRVYKKIDAVKKDLEDHKEPG